MSNVGVGRKGSVHRGFVADRAARFLAAEVAQLGELSRQLHGLDAEAARLCTEAMIATLLMSAWVKGRERITVQIQASKPRFAFMADADAQGGIRARFSPSRVVRMAGVDGLLHAIRADVKTEIYRGITPLDGRSIEACLSSHLRDSEQVDGILRIGVKQDDDGAIVFAGGLLVERLPTHDSLPWLTPEAFNQTFASVAASNVDDLLVELAFGKIAGKDIELLENRVATWRCDCSQERIEAVLLQLGAKELTHILHEDGKAEVSCHFCNVAYVVEAVALTELISLAEAAGTTN